MLANNIQHTESAQTESFALERERNAMDDLQASFTGLLSFPVTPFGADRELDIQRLHTHLEEQLSTRASAVFVACGTGELFSLTPEEHRLMVETAVRVAGGHKPVVAGVGYGTAIAMEMTTSAERAGAAGVLVLPPYLVTSPQGGLEEHYRRIAACTSIGVIPYQRDNAVLSPATAAKLATVGNIIAIKDGWGDTDHLVRIRLATNGNLPLMNGMPTAELTCEAYRACGVKSYSSAVLNFVPEIAESFFDAFETGDTETTERLLQEFYLPLVELRDQRAGYAVALVKAGVNLRRPSVGDVRPPLVAPDADHYRRLEDIISRGLAAVPPRSPGVTTPPTRPPT